MPVQEIKILRSIDNVVKRLAETVCMRVCVFM